MQLAKKTRHVSLSDALPPTRLEAFIRRRGIRPVDLEVASKVSRTHLDRLRRGEGDPGRRMIATITRACRRLTNDSSITALDLFELD